MTPMDDEENRQTQVDISVHSADGITGAMSDDTRNLLKRGATAKVEVGTVIDQRFVLESKLGQGGMSLVFRAKDLIKEQARDPNPYVAIKILTAAFSENPDAWIALQREIKKTQSLAHPRIVTVHDFQVDRETGLPFAQMEELIGEPLDSFIDKHPNGVPDRDQVKSLVMGIADGLAYAHSHGIVHSDLKPGNVFLTKKGGVKILDFGIARAVPGSDGDEFDAGSLGALTPAYASPEMFNREDPSPADDTFALGIIAYELYTGSHPYRQAQRDAKPALAARSMSLEAEKIKGLKRYEWKAISQALALQADQRTPDARVFLEKFRRRNPAVYYLSLLTLVLAGAAIWGIWLRPVELEPDIPFDELPLAQQEAITTSLENGHMALKMRDLNGALFYFSETFELHPYNPDAKEGLEMVVEEVLSQDSCSNERSKANGVRQIDALLEYEALSDSQELQNARQELLSC